MATLNPYLTFDGTCREAMTFYSKCLGGTLTLMTVGDSPASAQIAKENHHHIMHSSVTAGSLVLMASDRLGTGEHIEGTNISLMLQCGSEEEIRSLFAKFSEGGTVNTEFKVEFWGAMYGDVTDRFGLRWMFNYEKPKDESEASGL